MKKRTVIITKDNQCVQNIQLPSGRYTINFSIRTFNTSHKIACKKKSGAWEEFEITDLTPAKWKKKARLTFFLDEDAIAFNLCTSPVSPSSPVMIQDLMLEEGLNASTAKPNEYDIFENIEDFFDIEHIFYRNNELVAPDAPESLQQDDYVPEGWHDDPISATPTEQYVWHSFRQRVGNVWGAYTPPVLWANYAPAGEDVKMIEVRGNTSLKNPDRQGGISSTSLSVVKHGFDSTVKWEYFLSSWQATPWLDDIVIDYAEISSAFQNGVLQLRCFSALDPTIVTYVSITAVWDGDDGKSPYIGVNGNWWVWDDNSGSYVDSGDPAQGDDGKSPYIGVNGNWWVWDGSKYVDTNIKARGDDGKSPYIGENGNWWVWDDDSGSYVDSGDSAHGDDGKSPYIGANGNWWVWDGSKYVDTNIKARGDNGKSPYIGANGNWYVWDDNLGSYVDSGDPAQGDDGKSPYIGANGNWYVWDGSKYVDTNIKARGDNGKSPYIGANGNWYVWDDNLGSYVDSGDPAHGDDGKSPYIGANGNWWVWDGSKYIDTGIKAEGKDGASTEWGYLLNNSPDQPTKPTGTLPNGGWSYTMGSISPTNKYLWITSRTKEAGASAYGEWSTPALHAKWPDDGANGLPGQIPFMKEWVVGDRHRNSDSIIDYIYVRGSNAETSYWYQLIEKTDELGIVAGAIPVGGVTPTGYKAVTWLKELALKILLAEEANLANFIFKEEKLLSIGGTTFSGENIKYGEYTQYNFANTVSQPSTGSSSWTELPSGTLYWVRYKKNTESSWTVKKIGTSAGQWTMQFATAPEGDTWDSSYSTNHFWARVKEGSGDYGRPFKITTIGGYDFIPNVMLDGLLGEISGDKVIANNIRNKIWLAYSNNPTEIAAILGNGQSVNLSAASGQPVDYSWYTITLPNDINLAGSILTIHFPTASQKRYKIKTEKTNGIFYLNEPIKVLSELQVVNGVRGSIELKGVWDEINQSLDWHVISQVRYMLNMVHPTISRPSPYLLPNESVYRGRCSVSDSNPATLTKHYQSITTQITAAKNTSGTAKVIITVPMPTYFSATGSVLRRTAHNSGTLLRLEAIPNVRGRTMSIYSSYMTNSHWYFEVSVYNSTGTAIYGGFDFNIYTNDYLIQSEWMDNKFDNN